MYCCVCSAEVYSRAALDKIWDAGSYLRYFLEEQSFCVFVDETVHFCSCRHAGGKWCHEGLQSAVSVVARVAHRLGVYRQQGVHVVAVNELYVLRRVAVAALHHEVLGAAEQRFLLVGNYKHRIGVLCCHHDSGRNSHRRHVVSY